MLLFPTPLSPTAMVLICKIDYSVDITDYVLVFGSNNKSETIIRINNTF